MDRVGVDNLEDLRGVALGQAEQSELLSAQTECTFAFVNEAGWPSGVVMSFVEIDGGFWLTAVEGRSHVRAIATEPRVSLVVSNAGTLLPGRRMLALRGVATVHRDAGTKAWFFERFTARHQPKEPADFVKLLDSPNRVVIEVRPTAVAVSHDSSKIAGNGRGGQPGT